MLQLRYCSIEWTADGARVVFTGNRGPVPNGETVACPHAEQPHYHVIAHRCGYGDDVMAYCREHELAHAVISQELLEAPSLVLFGQAYELPVKPGHALLEEMAAQVLQRWVRANERPILAGHDWDAIKAKFLGYVEHLNAELRLL
jgi:heat shock protein HspQ